MFKFQCFYVGNICYCGEKILSLLLSPTNRISTMKYMKYFFFLVSLYVGAQEITLVTKNEVMVAAHENNNLLKIGEQNLLSSKGSYNQTNAVFLPNISASHTGISTTNPLMAFGSKLNQEILTQNDFNPNLLNDPSQIQSFSTKVEVKQPILNLDGIFARKAAKAKVNASQLQLERTKEYLTLQVEEAYMQLQLAYKVATVMETSEKAVLESLRIATHRFQQGYLQKADMLAVEVRVTEIKNKLQYSHSNIENASNYLSVLMGDTSFKLFKPLDSLKTIQEGVVDNTSVIDRADLKAMQYGVEAYKQMLKADKMNFLPRLNAFGSYELYDDELFKTGANGYLFGAQLSWTILEGASRFGKVQQSKAEFEKAKIEYKQYEVESKVELNKALRSLDDAKNNLELTRLAVEQSKEAYRIRTNRFKEGLEKTSDLLLAEAQYSQKHLEYYTTMYQYNYALAYVKYLTKN